MLALPGSAYLYQGEELGLPEVLDLPDERRQDPIFIRTGGQSLGRDGCRVPLPWTSTGDTFGFSSGHASWLPQPDYFAELSVDAQDGDPDSTLEMYRRALALRAQSSAMHSPRMRWLDSGEDVVRFTRLGTRSIEVAANLGREDVIIPAAELLLGSSPTVTFGDSHITLPPNTAVWLTPR